MSFTNLFSDCLSMTVSKSEAVSQNNERTCVKIPQSVTHVTPVAEFTLQHHCWGNVQNNSVSDLIFAGKF